MSLINDALKKAQRQRAPDGGPAAGSAQTVALAKRSQPLAAKWIVLLALGAVALVVVVAVSVTLFVLSDTPAPTSPAPHPAVVRTASATSAAASLPSTVLSPPPSVVSPPPTAATPPSSITSPPPLPVSTPSSPSGAPPSPATPATATAKTAPSSRAVDIVPAPETSTAVSPPPSAAPTVSFAIPKPDERITAYLDHLHVTGIRFSGTDSKALMNDRVYRAGDLVDRDLRLKLIKIAPETLTFEDPNGLTYTKNF